MNIILFFKLSKFDGTSYRSVCNGRFWSFCYLTKFFFYELLFFLILNVDKQRNHVKSSVERKHNWRCPKATLISPRFKCLNVDIFTMLMLRSFGLCLKMRHSPLGLTPSWYHDAFYKTKSERPKHYHNFWDWEKVALSEFHTIHLVLIYSLTLISLINVELGINVEGLQKLPNH